MQPTLFLISFIAAYILGAIPTAYLFGRYLKKIDIRKYGSGNIGATNALRVLGKGPGLWVFVIDFLKGFLPFFILKKVNLNAGGAEALVIWLGLAPILGHIFTPFLGFSGGKGVAASAGVLFAARPLLFGLAMSVWILSFVITKTVSISSLLAVSSILILALFFKLPPHYNFFFLAVFLLLVWTHRSNLRKILKGEEPKLMK